jgi:hypothetical protein
MKNCCIEKPNGETHTLVPLLCIEFFCKKISISIFGGISKFFKLIVIGQILEIFWQIWAHYVAFAVAKSMPKARLKS